MTIKGLLFDKDGTLFDFHATWTIWADETIRRLGEGDTARTEAIAGALDYDLSARQFLPQSSVIAGTVAEQAEVLLPYMEGRDVGEIARYLADLASDVEQVEVLPLVPYLQSLRMDGFALGVATNDAESSAKAHLSSVGALGSFDFLAGYDSGFGGKPEPGQLLAFSEQTGMDTAEVAMIGDSTHDLHAARAAGMVAVGVLTGPADEAQLAPHADVVLPSIAELPAFLAAR
ncbi:MAG: HAD family hydrolase [Pseudomonadota bacterium]